MRYEIHDNELRVFDDNDHNFLVQPFHPEARPWKDGAEIEAWAKNYLDNFGKEVVEEAPTPALEG